MNALRTFAMACVVTEAAVFTIATRNVVTGVMALVIVAAAIAMRDRKIAIARNGMTGIIVGIAVFCGLWMILFPYDRPGPFDFWGDAMKPVAGAFSNPAFAHAIGMYALIFQALQLIVNPQFAPGTPRMLRMFWGLDYAFPLYAMPVLVCAGDLIAAPSLQLVFLIGSLLCIACGSVYLTILRNTSESARRIPVGAWMWLAMALVFSAAIGTTMSGIVYTYGHQADRFIGQYLTRVPNNYVGFSSQSSLGSIANVQSTGDAVALRVYADHAPGYLRGKTYNTLSSSSWYARGRAEAVFPTADSAGQNTFPILEESPVTKSVDVWPASNLPNLIFYGDNLVAVGSESETLAIDETDNITVNTKGRYRLDLGTDVTRAPTAEELERSLEIPDELEPGVHDLAKELLDGSRSAHEAGSRLMAYFNSEYQYEIGIRVPVAREPISYFLLEKPPAHCEYFASASVVLLRIAGYPARYVTGFVAAEEGGFGEYWVARSRHAHAWCEVYDPDHGWILIEPTPANGLPEVAEVSAARRWSEYMGHLIHRIRVAVGALDLVGLFNALGTRGGFVLIAGGLFVLALASWPWLRRLRWRSDKGGEEKVDTVPQVQRDLHELLARADEVTHARGFDRDAAETFSSFSRRLNDEGANDCAEWYARYETVRFSGRDDSAEVSALRQSLPNIGQN